MWACSDLKGSDCIPYRAPLQGNSVASEHGGVRREDANVWQRWPGHMDLQGCFVLLIIKVTQFSSGNNLP